MIEKTVITESTGIGWRNLDGVSHEYNIHTIITDKIYDWFNIPHSKTITNIRYKGIISAKRFINDYINNLNISLERY